MVELHKFNWLDFRARQSIIALMNQINVTVRFLVRDLLGFDVVADTATIGKTLGMHPRRITIEGDTGIVSVLNLTELFEVSQKFEPGYYVTVQMEKIDECGSDYLSMTLDD